MKEPAATSRFVDITDKHRIDMRHLESMGFTKHCVLITDYKWYTENLKEIEQWCKQTIPYSWRNGTIMFFGTEREKMMFLLKWSN